MNSHVSIKNILELCDESIKINIHYMEDKETGIDNATNHLNNLEEYILGDWVCSLWIENDVLILAKR